MGSGSNETLDRRVGVVLVDGVREVWFDLGLINYGACRRTGGTGIEMAAVKPRVHDPVDKPPRGVINAVHHAKQGHQRTEDVFRQYASNKWQVIQPVCSYRASRAHSDKPQMWIAARHSPHPHRTRQFDRAVNGHLIGLGVELAATCDACEVFLKETNH